MPDKPINPGDYEEEEKPFDDVMRQLLQAKPKHREAEKPKPTKRGGKGKPAKEAKP